MREKIAASNIYHVVNRGVDKRKIFLDDEDYLRFIHDLFEFNDKDRVFNEWRLFKSENIMSKGQLFDVGRRTVKEVKLE